MNEMIERVAKAIIDAGYNPITAEHIDCVAIKAMREPTEAMEDVAVSSGCWSPMDAIDLVWKPLIDEALK